MKRMQGFVAVAALAFAATAAAQTKWDMPTPYAATNFHTENVVQFAADVEKAFRDYLTLKGGRTGPIEGTDAQIVGLDAYWLAYKSPAPGGSAPEVTGREKLFSHSRGGKGDTKIPILRPSLLR